MPSRTALALLAAGALALAVGACGRRGPLEPPPDPKAAAAPAQGTGTTGQTVARESEEDSDSMSPTPIGQAKKRPRGIAVPKTPFLLDPLL